MKISGQQTIPFPVESVWTALLDPEVLVATIPGCEQLAATAEHSYRMTVSAGVGAIRGTYDGTCEMSDLAPHESLVMRLRGAGAPGTIDATVDVRFAETGDGTTVRYDADATVGGMVGGVGQRMLTSVSERMAREFFGNVTQAITGGGAAGGRSAAAGPSGASAPSAATPAPTVGQVFTAPARPGGVPPDFAKGVVVGAGLVLLGVLAGAVLGRRRT